MYLPEKTWSVIQHHLGGGRSDTGLGKAGLGRAREEWAYILNRLKAGHHPKAIKQDIKKLRKLGNVPISQQMQSIAQNTLAAQNTVPISAVIPFKISPSFSESSPSLARESISTIPELISVYLTDKHSQFTLGQISRPVFIEYQHMAKFFEEFCLHINKLNLADLNVHLLEQYKQFIIQLTNADFAKSCETAKIGSVVVHTRLAKVKKPCPICF